MNKLLTIALLFLSTTVFSADLYKTLYNPFTRAQDYVNLTVGTATYSNNSDKLDGYSSTDFGLLSATQTWTGTNTFGASTKFKVDTTTFSITLDMSYNTVITSNTLTITLPTAIGNSGLDYYIVYRGTSSCVIDGNDSETINESMTQTIYPFEAVHIKSDNTGWWTQ